MDRLFTNARLKHGALNDIAVRDGHIAAITPSGSNPTAVETVDLGGLLVIPAFVEGHIHLDTSFYGDRWIPHKPCTNGFDVHERVAFQAENVLAAVGAAWALDIPVELIRAGIETFDIDQADAPWQFTLFERNGSTVVVDDVHNASALRPLIAAIDQFPSARRAAVYSAGADRRDADLIEQGKLLGDAFDRVVLYDDLTVRSKRPAGQARALLRQGLAQGALVKDVQEEPDHGKAIESQLNGIAAGDFVLLQSDEAFSGPTIDLVRRWIQQY